MDSSYIKSTKEKGLRPSSKNYAEYFSLRHVIAMLFGHTFYNTVPVGATAGILQPYEMWSGMTAYKFHRGIRYIRVSSFNLPPTATLTRFLSYRLFLITSRRRTSLDVSVSAKCQSLSNSLYGGAKSYQPSFLLSSRQVRYLTFGHTLHTFFALQCFYTGFPLVTKNTHLIRNSIPLRHQQRLITKRSLTSCLNSHTQGSASVF